MRVYSDLIAKLESKIASTMATRNSLADQVAACDGRLQTLREVIEELREASEEVENERNLDGTLG